MRRCVVLKKGLVLEGGAMRGLFSCGVTDVLLENGVTFDGMIGVSAGAALGCNFKSRQSGRAIRYNVRFCKDKRFCSVSSLIKTGDMFGADFCYHEVPEKYDKFDFKAFEENPMEFYLVATNVETGRPVYKKCKKMDNRTLEWMRASASMPLVSNIVEVDGYKMLDGGISDSVPLKFFKHIGYEKNVVVLTQPEGYVKKPNKLLPIMRVKYAKYPNFVKTVKNRYKMYNDQIKYIENEKDTLIIRPEAPLPISRTDRDPEHLLRVYDIGREIALENLDKIKRFLNII